MTRLLIADDHSIIRIGLKLIIGSCLQNCTIEEAHDGNSCFEKIKEHPYDLLILDIHMPGTDSLALVRNIFAFLPSMKILVISASDEEAYAGRYLKMGVMGYIKKGEPPEEIQKAVTMVLNNKKYISPGLSESIIENLKRGNSQNPFDNLSARELEIARYLAGGKSIAEICQKLHLHSSTVGTHKARLFEKMHCSNIIDLNTMAKMYNIIL